LTTITAAIAPYVGVAAGALVTGSAAILYAVAIMGKNALCQGEPLEVRLPAKPG
jgi:hypothetical protein